MWSGAAAKILPWLGKFLESSRNGLLLSMYIQFEGWILAIMTFSVQQGCARIDAWAAVLNTFHSPEVEHGVEYT